MNVPYIVATSAITVFLNGKPTAIDDSHPNYQVIRDHLKANTGDAATLADLVSIPKWLNAKINHGDVYVTEDDIYYKGDVIHSFLRDRILDMLSNGYDVMPWVKFMNNLYSNPSQVAIDELFLWLEKAQMPITPEGNFLAYKKVKDDYTSYHRGVDGLTVHNNIGTTVQMERLAVDDNRYRTCSAGLHFCSFSYLRHYHGGTGKVMILEINPADVVAIPADYDNAKGRAWRYDIVGEVAEADVAFAFDGKYVANPRDPDYEDDDRDDGFFMVDEDETTEDWSEWYS